MLDFKDRYFLIGIAAAVVPLLIFLLTRDRARKVAFSTLRFFANASSKLLKRKRWQEMLLLAMRMGICALLAVAFARPLLKKYDAAEGDVIEAASALALVVDVSASMGQGGAFEQAHQAADKALDEVPSDAAVTLIAFDRTPRVEAGWTRDLTSVRVKMAAIAPGAGGTDLAAAIRKADEVLQQIAAPQKQIVVVSDVRRNGWEGFSGNYRLHRGVKLDIRAVKPEKTADVAMVAADFPQCLMSDTEQRAITVRIANFASQPAQDLPVRLKLNDADQETQKVNLAANDTAVVRLRCKFDRVGDNRAVVQLGEKENKSLGSTLYINARVLPKIEVLVLTAGNGDRPERDAEFFLRTALAPSVDSPFVVKCQPSADATVADLSTAGVVMLADVDSVSAGIQKALGEVLRRGGGLLFLPGARVNPETFARSFADLAPCQLRRVVAAGELRRGAAKAVLAKIDYEHPIFEIFNRPHFGDFSTVRFDRYWEVTDSQLAKIPARFDDGRPLMVERALEGGPGQWGRAALLTSPVDARWNNLPDRAIFLPFLHQITGYLTQHTEPATAYQVGDVLPTRPQHSLRDPSGKVFQGGSFRAEQCGFYELLDAGGKVVFSYAVNSDLAETNPATVDPAEIKAALESPSGPEAETLAGVSEFVGQSGQEIWAYLVAALLLLAISELFLANRVARH